MAVLHPCPRCKRMIPVGVAYCDHCRPAAEAQARAAVERRQAFKRHKAAERYNRRRDPKYLKFYRSKAWRTLSRAKLQDAGYHCQAKQPHCTGIACEVHHIQPIQTPEGWERRLDWGNLEAVCTRCHNSRHANRWKGKKNSSVLDVREVAHQCRTPGGG